MMNRRLATAVIMTAFVFFFGLSACAAAAAATERAPDPAQLYANAGSSQSTAQSAYQTAQFYGGQITATVVAQQATATERAWILTEAQITNTAQAMMWTAQASDKRETATAAYLATQQAADFAATAVSAASTTTVSEARTRAEVERIANELERQRLTNRAWAVSPLAAAAMAFFVALYLIYKHGRIRAIRPDASGRPPYLLLDVADDTVLKPNLLFYPQTGLRRKDLIPAPPPLLQAGVVEGSQALEMTQGGASPEAVRRRPLYPQIERAAPPPPLPPALKNEAKEKEEKPLVTVVAPENAQARMKDVFPSIMLEAAEEVIEGEAVKEEA